jgi:hypothetical protein
MMLNFLCPSRYPLPQALVENNIIQRLDQMTEMFQQRFNAMDQRFDNFNERFNRLESRMDLLSTLQYNAQARTVNFRRLSENPVGADPIMPIRSEGGDRPGVLPVGQTPQNFPTSIEEVYK